MHMKRRNFLRVSSLLPFLNGKLATAEQLTNPLAPRQLPMGHPPVAPVGKEFFYKPEGAWAADFIPLYAEGKFQLFYLLDWRDSDHHGEGTPWYRLSTTDFVHFEEHGEAIPRGTKDQQDLYIFTGSAIKGKDNRYHIFYTGHNPYLAEQGKPMQGVMHAVSDDLQHWTKIREHTFFAPADRYEPHDWRDPYVFFDESSGEYHMLLAARFKQGIPRRRGLTAHCTSKDLVSWQVQEPFYAPNEFYTHECPDLFKMGDWWYLVFSEFTDKVATRYRMSRSLKGPWIAPPQDSFDGHAFYAAKTASDGRNRYIFGWNPTRSDNKDNGGWNWGGNLVVHQIIQQSNGELTVRVPETVRQAFGQRVQQSFKTAEGKPVANSGDLSIRAEGKFDAVMAEKMPGTCRISTTVQYTKAPREFGCMLRCSEDLDKSYYIRLEPHQNRLVFDVWPRAASEVSQMVELERQISLPAGQPVLLEVYMDGNKGVVYVNNIVAMNFRAYDLAEGNWGFFVTDGTARFSKISLTTI
jgi:beta-fructofuranosidase